MRSRGPWVRGDEDFWRLAAAKCILLREPSTALSDLVKAQNASDDLVRGRAFDVLTFVLIIQDMLSHDGTGNLRQEYPEVLAVFEEHVGDRELAILCDAAVAAAVRAAGDTNSELRWRAVRTLGRSGTRGLPHLLDLLRNPESAIRSEAVMGLASVDATGKVAVPEMLRVIKDDPDSQVRCSAVVALSELADRGSVGDSQIDEAFGIASRDSAEDVQQAAKELASFRGRRDSQ